jgi:hypothetical protein
MKRLVQVDPFAPVGINRIFEAGSGLSVGSNGIYLPMSGQPNSGSKFVIEPWNEIVKLPPEEWLIKRLFPCQGLAVIFGKPSSFKSFVALDVALSVALGRSWAGRKVRQGSVVYVAAEGAGGLRKRISALKEKHKLSDEIPFGLISAAPNFGVGIDDLNALIQVVSKLQSLPKIIVLDTLSQSLGGADENGAGMINFVKNATALSINLKTLVLIVHHSGLGDEKRLRGHSSLHAGIDAQILCERNNIPFQTVLSVQKVKDETSDTNYLVHLTREVLGIDEDGDEISTLVIENVEETDGSNQSAPKSKDIPKQQRLLTEVVLHAIDEVGESFRPFGQEGPIVRGVSEAAARQRYYQRLAEQAEPDENIDRLAARQRKAFSRSVNSMADAKRLVTGNHNGVRFLWFP